MSKNNKWSLGAGNIGRLQDFQESMISNLKLIEGMDHDKAKEHSEYDHSSIEGVKHAIDYMVESIADVLNVSNPEESGIFRSGFRGMVSDSETREIMKKAFTEGLKAEIADLETAMARGGSLEDSNSYKEKLDIYNECLENVDKGIAGVIDNMEEQISYGRFSPIVQLTLPYVFMFSIRNTANKVVAFTNTDQLVKSIKRKRRFITIDGVEYNILDVTNNRERLEALKARVNTDLVVTADTSTGSAFVNMIDNAAGLPSGYTSEDYSTNEIVTVESFIYDNAGVDKEIKFRKAFKVGPQNRYSDTVTQDGFTINVTKKEGTAEVSVLVTGPNTVKSVKLKGKLVADGYRMGGATPVTRYEEESYECDQVTFFNIPQDELKRHKIISLATIDPILDITAAIKELSLANEDASVFGAIDDQVKDLKDLGLIDGKVTVAGDYDTKDIDVKIDSENAFFNRVFDRNDLGSFRPATPVQWNKAILGQKTAQISTGMNMIYNAPTGTSAVGYCDPMAILYFHDTNTVVESGSKISGVQVDYGINTIKAGNTTTRIVVTERATPNEVTYIPKSTSAHQPTIEFAKYKDMITDTIRDAANPLVPNTSMISIYGIRRYIDVAGKIVIK